jgi:hypothetical protein
MFWDSPQKKNWRRGDHNVVRLSEILFFKKWVTVVCNWFVPNNPWSYADIGLTTGFLNKTNSSYMTYFGGPVRLYKGVNIFLSAMFRRDASTIWIYGNSGFTFPPFS